MTLAARITLASSHGSFVGSMTEIFEQRTAERPDSVALSFDGAPTTYGQLNMRANQVAARLRELGAGAGQLIGIYLDRSPDLLVSILAVLKTGAAYLPLDLACPEDRLEFQLGNAQALVLLTHSSLAVRLKFFPGTLICLDKEAGRLAAQPVENIPVPVPPDDLAYVIYTSGSTGQPKGVMVTQRNVLRLLTTTEPLFHFGKDDVWSLFFSSAFDFSVWEIFGALLYGGRLVIVPYMVSRSAKELHALVRREHVTVLNQTPSAFRQIIAVDNEAGGPANSLKYVILGGEALDFQNLRPWFEHHGDQQPQCVNMYGITETTVHTTHYVVRRADLDQPGSNIGIALPDLEVRVVNEQGDDVAPGEMGEMLVGGPGVALGYLNRPELTAERFIPDPRAPDSAARLYRSGDLARQRPDGNLEYLGRADQQVKIRGFRVELPEIEAALLRHPNVRECAVISRSDDGVEARLVAYLISRDGAEIGIDTLRTQLAKSLPEYMVPSAYVFLKEFPLTLNGKLDRRALPAPGFARPQLAASFAAPQGELEPMLAGLWSEALGHENIGAEDNFFDLGGDSLILTTLHRRLESRLGQPVPITDLFQFPTIRALAAHLAVPNASGNLVDKATARAEQRRAALARARRSAETSA